MENKTVEYYENEIKRLKMICKLADVPELVIESLSFDKPSPEDIDWAKKEIERLRNHNKFK